MIQEGKSLPMAVPGLRRGTNQRISRSEIPKTKRMEKRGGFQ